MHSVTDANSASGHDDDLDEGDGTMQRNAQQTRRTPRQRPRASVIMATLATVFFAAALVAAGPAADAQATDTLTPQGIGDAVVGSTLAQLQAQLGPTYTFGPATDVLVDVQGYEVSQAGSPVFIAAAVNGTAPLEATSELTLFVVRNEGPVTAAGIGVGSTIEDGVAAYGPVTLSFNTENEGREFARFENQPAGLSFRTGSGATAGIYPDSDDSFRETTEFIAGAEIQAVWVSCGNVANPCPPQPTLPDTGASHALLLVLSAALAGAGFVLVLFERKALAELPRH